jgi:hypothetical protein
MSLSNIYKPRVSFLAKSEGKFIEANLPVQAFAHLTAPWRVERQRLLDQFREWILGLQDHHRITLGWVRTLERWPSPHIHAALIAAAPLDCTHAALLWRAMIAARYSEAAKVEVYRDGCCGLGYVLKQLDTNAEEIQFSDNISAFAGTAGQSAFPATRAQLRQRRRIRQQLMNAASNNA